MICSIENCAKKTQVRGWCYMHYTRWYKHGDVNWTPPTPADRFWDKVDKSGDCWEWMGGKMKNGYGQFTLNSKAIKAHRFVYALEVGPIPDGLCVLHRCDNPSCVNPEHLFLGTHADNMRDRNEKGRQFSKLTEEQVLEIRSTKGLIHRSVVAEKYNVTPDNISQILNRRIWTHI